MIDQLIAAIERAAFDKKAFSIAGSEFSPSEAKQIATELKKAGDSKFCEGFSKGIYAARDALNERFGL